MSMRGRHATIHRLGKSTQRHATFGTAALVVPALLLTVNNWKSHKSPSTREWIRKLSHVYATGYQSPSKKKKLHIAGTAFDVKKLNARASSQFLCATLAVPQNKWKRYLRALTTEEQLTGETQNCVCPVSPPASRGLPPRQDSEKKNGTKFSTCS